MRDDCKYCTHECDCQRKNKNNLEYECLSYECKEPLVLNFTAQDVKKNRFYGGLFGSAVGDALGVPVEFSSRKDLCGENAVTGMRAFGRHYQPMGTWSDDTSMTLCLIDALSNGGGLEETAYNFVKWYMNGKFTATGRVFDVGNTCYTAIYNIINGVDVYNCGSYSVNSNGNGGLMRIIPLAFKNDVIIKEIEDYTSLTHGHIISKFASIFYVLFVKSLYNGLLKEDAYNYAVKNIPSMYLNEKVMSQEIYARIVDKSLLKSDINFIKSTGYVVDTLEAAIYCFMTTNNYKDCVLKAVNLGGDTDTIGCIAGGLAGSYYGFSDIPDNWIQMLMLKEELYSIYNKYWKFVN